MKIRPLIEQDFVYLSVLLDTAFNGPEEYKRMTELREAGSMALEMVIEDEGGKGPIGYISFVRHVSPDGWWALALEVVNRSERGKGLGGKLVSYGLDAARQAGAAAVTVIGEPDYYKRFGFSDEAAKNLSTPFEKSATLVYPIVQGSAQASVTLTYPNEYLIA